MSSKGAYLFYSCLNGNTDPLTTAVPNIADLTALNSSTRYKRYVLYGSLTRKGQKGICFSLGRCIMLKYPFSRLLRGTSLHPLLLMLHLLSCSHLTPPRCETVPTYGWHLIGEDSHEETGEAAPAIWEALHEAEIEIPPEKCQGPSKEVTFGYLFSRKCSSSSKQMLQSKKELQQLMGTWGYWRKHVLGVSTIALYSEQCNNLRRYIRNNLHSLNKPEKHLICWSLFSRGLLSQKELHKNPQSGNGMPP